MNKMYLIPMVLFLFGAVGLIRTPLDRIASALEKLAEGKQVSK